MKLKLSLILVAIMISQLFAQNVEVPEYYEVDKDLSAGLMKIVSELELDKTFDVGEDGTEQISFAVIDLSKEKPMLGGVNYDNFIYPASVYKMYVAAQLLEQVYNGKYELDQQYRVKSPNDVDRSKEIETDPRPLLKDGDVVSINYLLDLMITRSDNSAANCCIDLADRKNINKMMKANNWIGSEVTRKYLSRKYEDPGYEKIRGTETCALHGADFMYKIETGQMINPWVSMQLKALLGRQLDKSKIASGLPREAMYYHKTGWFSFWTNDVGIVDDGKVKYVVSCFIPVREEELKPKYELLAKKVHELMKERNK